MMISNEPNYTKVNRGNEQYLIDEHQIVTLLCDETQYI